MSSNRDAIVAVMNRMASTAKKAHRPILSGITLQTYREGNAKMMYFIDAEKNHSKFYECLIQPDSSGMYVLQRRWGGLDRQRRGSR